MDSSSRPLTTSHKSNTQRRRTAYACVSCRTRKTRCDGRDPCTSCTTLDVECRYDHDITSTKAKSDLILSAILRLESSISDIDRKISANLDHHRYGQHRSPPSVEATPGQFSTPSLQNVDDANSLPKTYTSYENDSAHEFNNATISPDHTSTTEAILHWPVFDIFPELRREGVLKSGAIFWMENSRQRQVSRDTVMPFLSDDELNTLIAAFQRTLNFSYPIVPQRLLFQIQDQYSSNEMDDSIMTCLTMLVMAMGCAAETVSLAYETNSPDSRRLSRLRSLGRIFFNAAVARLHIAYSTISMECTLCLALSALYYAYLQRPIQAWSMLSSTATACRVMTSYSTYDDEQVECMRRVFWMCYILESDYLAELPALPHFGIGEMESSVTLPSHFITHEDPLQNELSSLHFTACISMRRLLNRCHDLLFGTKSGRIRNARHFASVVAELDQQLEDWKRLLPPLLNFSIDTEPTNSQHAGFLRQRYLTCRALIYRSYVMDVIADHTAHKLSDDVVVQGAQRCLQASLLHILNLRPFNQTVLVDVWICSLSMAGTMMILLVAATTAALRDSLFDQLPAVGTHLLSLLEPFADVHGETRSPSVDLAIEWIKIVDGILRRELHAHSESTSPRYRVQSA